MRRWGWILPLLLTSCATLRPNTGREGGLLVYAHFTRDSQTLVSPNTYSSIATMDIIPYVEVSAGTFSPISSVTGNPTDVGASDVLKLTQASPSIDPSQPFLFNRLKPQTNYRIYGLAYNAANAKISLDASSYVDVAVGNNNAPSVAQVPVHLIDTPFGAATTVTVNTEGRYDYLKGTLSLVAGNTQVAIAQTTRLNPDFTFTNLQGNTSYRLLVEAYKLGGIVASNSVNLSITNDSTPVLASMALNIPYVVTTLAGSPSVGFVDGTGTAARFNTPCAVALDLQGNLLVAEHANSCVRKVTPQGVVKVLAGAGVSGFLDGSALAAKFDHPVGVCVDNQGNIYVGDTVNHKVRKITPDGTVSTLAGNGTAGYNDGAGSTAMFNGLYGVAVDPAGNVYVADYSNHRIRKITSAGVVSTLAGNGTNGFNDGAGASAMFTNVHEVVVDSHGNVFTTDASNCRIRKITPDGTVSTFAGSGSAGAADGTGASATFNGPRGLGIDNKDNLYVVDSGNVKVRKITPAAVVTTLVGGGANGYLDGTGTAARFNSPYGVAVDNQGIIYVGDENNNCIRMVQ